MEAGYQKVVRFEVTAKCVQPMHIGSGDADGSVLVRESDGVPFIPGTSIAGVFKSYIQQVKGDAVADELFGGWDKQKNRNRKSHVWFSEGIFVDMPQVEMRTRVSIDGETGSVKSREGKGTDQLSGQVLDMEYISVKSKFSFVIYLFDADVELVVRECLAAMHQGILKLGGMSTIGCGKVDLVAVNEKLYNMTKEADRNAWKDMQPNEINKIGDDITKEIEEMNADNPYYELIATIRLRTPLLVRANTVDSDEAIKLLGNADLTVNTMPLMNGQKEFIIPGSSLKGVFRSRMETIAEYRNCKKQVENVFENKSSCIFEDAVIVIEDSEGKDLVNRQPRIHINKITGGAMDKSLFMEMTIGGESTWHINVEKAERKEEALSAEAILGLLLYVLRDFQVGAVTVGSGSGIGRGYIDVDQVTLADGSVILENFSMHDPAKAGDFAARCMNALSSQA